MKETHVCVCVCVCVWHTGVHQYETIVDYGLWSMEYGVRTTEY